MNWILLALVTASSAEVFLGVQEGRLLLLKGGYLDQVVFFQRHHASCTCSSTSFDIVHLRFPELSDSGVQLTLLFFRGMVAGFRFCRGSALSTGSLLGFCNANNSSLLFLVVIIVKYSVLQFLRFKNGRCDLVDEENGHANRANHCRHSRWGILEHTSLLSMSKWFVGFKVETSRKLSCSETVAKR